MYLQECEKMFLASYQKRLVHQYNIFLQVIERKDLLILLLYNYEEMSNKEEIKKLFLLTLQELTICLYLNIFHESLIVCGVFAKYNDTNVHQMCIVTLLDF